MEKNRKQQLLRGALDLLLCVVFAAVLALAVDLRIKEVVNQTIEDYKQDRQRTEWVRAAKQVSDTVPSLVIPEGDGNNK